MKKGFQYIITLIVSLILTALPVSGQSLLDGKKWTWTDLATNKPSCGFMDGGVPTPCMPADG